MSANTSKPNRKRQFDTPRTPQEDRKASGTRNEQSQEVFRGENEPVNLGKIIAGGRKRLGWSQKTLADNSDYGEKTIWNVENGITEKPQTISELRDELNIALKKKGEDPIPWPSLEKTLELRETYEKHPVIAASRLSSRGRNAGYELLVGRDNERNALDLAWDGNATEWQRVFNRHANKELNLTGPPIRPRIIVVNAWAGIGKTSIVARWAADKLAQEKHSGITRYFDWPFYVQGTRQEGDALGSTKTASAEQFLNQALEHFGDSALAASNAKAWQKGERLAQLIGQHRTLIILDGLESMQDAKSGELYDDGLRALLCKLAAHNPGLCLVTTRMHLPELAVWQQSTAPEWKLASLTNEAGAALLTKLGVNGTKQEKCDLSSRVKGHALSLALLGRYLDRVHHGDIRRVDRVDFKNVNEKEQGGHAFRVIAAYERWFVESKCNAELAILRVLGLFDRPATPDCFAVLLDPPIPRLTDAVAALNEDDWNEATTRLVELDLVEKLPWESVRYFGYSEKIAKKAMEAGKQNIAFPIGKPILFEPQQSFPGIQDSLDTHPLIRAYFAKQLKETAAKKWKVAHGRLFEYLRNSVPYWPEGLEGLQPLYHAVVHGCQAKKYQPALVEVYSNRICRGTSGLSAYYSARKLGAVGADLAALACFFTRYWTETVRGLTRDPKSELLNEAAYRLSALGRLSEAREPMQVSMELDKINRKWKGAAASGFNLTELDLALGNVSAALTESEHAVTFAKRSREAFLKMVSRTVYADALHQAGRMAEAKVQLEGAEALQRDREPEFQWLYSTGGFRFCDLLLTDVERDAWRSCCKMKADKNVVEAAIRCCLAVEIRAIKTLGWAVCKARFGPLTIAFDHLTLGRVELYRAILERNSLHLAAADSHVEDAVRNLRDCGRLDHLPRGLLTRAWLQAVKKNQDLARADLEEAQHIAKRGPMLLHLADVHLHRARLFYDKNELNRARALIKKCGYWRRKQELEDAEVAAKHW